MEPRVERQWQVLASTPGRALLRNDFGQVVHTHQAL